MKLILTPKEKGWLVQALYILAEEYEKCADQCTTSLSKGFANDAAEIRILANRADALLAGTLDDRLRELLDRGQIIDAIKLRRSETGEGLKEAKDYVDTLRGV